MKTLEAGQWSPWWDSDMLSLFLTAVGAAIVALLVFAISTGGEKRREKRGRRLPPGPRPWPIVGNFGELGAFIHRDLAKLAKKYGPILWLRLGSVRTIVISSPKLAEEVFKTHDRVFASRPHTTNSRILTYDNQNIIFAPPGPYWRQARKLLTLELLTAQQIQGFRARRTEEVLRMLHSILDECKDGTAAVCVEDKFMELAWNIISRMMINKRFFSESGKDKTKLSRECVGEYVEVFLDVLRSFNAFVVGDYIPLLRGIDVRGIVRQLWESRRRMDVIMDQVIEEHQKRLKLSPGSAGGPLDDAMDMVDVMLTRPGGVEKDDKPFTIDQIKGILNDGFVAGTDASANTLTWAMAEVLRNPHVLKRAQEELNDVVGRDRMVQESDIPRLPYLRAAVEETFRLHPVLPLLVPRESVVDCEVGGYFIPAGTQTSVNVWAIGRDASIWDRALEFWPERFLGNDMDVMGQNFELLPFGSGRRSCPGKALGLLSIQYTLAVLLHACDWILPEGMNPEDIDVSEGPGVISHLATPLRLACSARLSNSVIYSRP